VMTDSVVEEIVAVLNEAGARDTTLEEADRFLAAAAAHLPATGVATDVRAEFLEVANVGLRK
jgi:hypothetical protein